MSLAEKAFNLGERSPGGPAWIRAMRMIQAVKNRDGLTVHSYIPVFGETRTSTRNGDILTKRFDRTSQSVWLGTSSDHLSAGEKYVFLKEFGPGSAIEEWDVTSGQQARRLSINLSNWLFPHWHDVLFPGLPMDVKMILNGTDYAEENRTYYPDQYFYDLYYAMGYTELPFKLYLYSPSKIYSSPWMRTIDLDIVPGTNLLASLPGVLSGQNIQGESVELNIEHLNLDFTITSIT